MKKTKDPWAVSPKAKAALAAATTLAKPNVRPLFEHRLASVQPAKPVFTEAELAYVRSLPKREKKKAVEALKEKHRIESTDSTQVRRLIGINE